MANRVGYAAGNIPARDVIYWPRITAAQLIEPGVYGITDPRIAGCNRAAIMALSWRVRHFELSGSASVEVHYKQYLDTFGVPPYNDVTRLLEWSLPTVFCPMVFGDPGASNPVTEAEALQRELDIVSIYDQALYPVGLQFLHNGGFLGRSFENVGFSGSQHSELINPPDPPVITDDSLNGTSAQALTEFAIFGSDQDKMAVVYDPGSGLFYPHVSVLCQMNAASGNGSDVSGSGANAAPVGASDGALIIDPLVAATLEIPMKAANFFQSGMTGIEVISVSGSFSLTANAVKFWPYANSQGLPVYDEVTGAQLVSPFS